MLFKTVISKDLQQIKFFSLDRKLRTALVLFAFACQLISGFTEYMGFAPFFVDLLKPLFSHFLSNFVGHLLAIAIATFIEFLLYYLVGFIIVAIKEQYLAFQEGDKIDQLYNKIKFWSASTILLVLIVFSMFLSKRNVKFQVESTAFEVATTDLSQFDTLENQKTTLIESRFEKDKNALINSYQDNKTLKESEFTAKRDAVKKSIDILKRKEQREGKSYTTQRNVLEQKIINLQEQQAVALQVIQTKYDTDLAAIKTNRDTNLVSVTTLVSTDKNQAGSENQARKEANKRRTAWIGFVLQWLSSLSVLGFVVARSWVCMADATAGIQEKAIIEKDSLEKGVFGEFWMLIGLSIERRLQNAIRKRLAKIPDLIPLKEEIPVPYPMEEKEQVKNEWENVLAETLGEPNEQPAPRTGQPALFSLNTFYVEPDIFPISLPLVNPTNIVEYEPKRTVIQGFSPRLPSLRKSYNETIKENSKVCASCNQGFTPNHKKQIYCSDKCRITNWEQKTGNNLKLKKKKG